MSQKLSDGGSRYRKQLAESLSRLPSERRAQVRAIPAVCIDDLPIEERKRAIRLTTALEAAARTCAPRRCSALGATIHRRKPKSPMLRPRRSQRRRRSRTPPRRTRQEPERSLRRLQPLACSHRRFPFASSRVVAELQPLLAPLRASVGGSNCGPWVGDGHCYPHGRREVAF